MSTVTDFIDALTRASWPALEGFTRPFERADLERSIAERCPQLQDSVDDTVAEWWQWAGQLEPAAVIQAIRPYPEIVLPYGVAPDGAELGALDHLLDMVAQRIDTLGSHELMFPIMSSTHNCLYGLRRSSTNEPWRISYADREDSHWRPVQRVWYRQDEIGAYRQGTDEVETPTFEDWLARIINGLETGELEVSNRGAIELADPPNNLDDARRRYPWR